MRPKEKKSKADKIIVTSGTILIVSLFIMPIFLILKLDFLMKLSGCAWLLLASIFFGTIFFEIATRYDNFLNR